MNISGAKATEDAEVALKAVAEDFVSGAGQRPGDGSPGVASLSPIPALPALHDRARLLFLLVPCESRCSPFPPAVGLPPRRACPRACPAQCRLRWPWPGGARGRRWSRPTFSCTWSAPGAALCFPLPSAPPCLPYLPCRCLLPAPLATSSTRVAAPSCMCRRPSPPLLPSLLARLPPRFWCGRRLTCGLSAPLLPASLQGPPGAGLHARRRQALPAPAAQPGAPKAHGGGAQGHGIGAPYRGLRRPGGRRRGRERGRGCRAGRGAGGRGSRRRGGGGGSSRERRCPAGWGSSRGRQGRR